MIAPNRPSAVAVPDRLDGLLQRTAAGDRGAFAELYKLSAPQLFGLAIRMLRRRDLAEEVMQETFILVWGKANGFDPAKGRALSWMASIVRNKCIDRIRVRRPETSLDDEASLIQLVDPAPAAIDRLVLSADARTLTRCLDRLEPGPRDAILRVYYDGLTHMELAERTSQPLGTLKSWIRRGLQRLKSCLEA